MLLEDCSAGLCRAQKPGSVDRVDGTLGVLKPVESNMTATCGKSLSVGAQCNLALPGGTQRAASAENQ
jgi:hypothetical protein